MFESLELQKGDIPQKSMLSIQKRIGIFPNKFNHRQKEDRGRRLLIFAPDSKRIDIGNHSTNIEEYILSVLDDTKQQLIICFFDEDVNDEIYAEFWNAFKRSSKQYTNFCIVFCGREETIPEIQTSNILELQFTSNPV